MGDDKTKAQSNASILPDSGLNGKTVTSVRAHKNGSVVVLEVGFSGGSGFIKVRGGEVEAGGNHDWGSGAKVL